MASVTALHDLDLLERFSSILSQPAHPDERVLSELENHTSSYWHHRSQATFSSATLLESARVHLSLLIHLLHGPLSLSERQRLCAIGSEITQVIGMLLFDLGRYIQARQYFHTAIGAAQEAGHSLLEAVAWGNLSFAWIYDNHPREALPCIQKARRIASANADVPWMLQAELAGREAEVFSLLGEYDACLGALAIAEHGASQTAPVTLHFGIHFDLARWAGYQGACFRRFYQQQNQETHAFLPQAEQALQTALQHVPPLQSLRRSTLELDLAEVLFARKDLEEALSHALQAAIITRRTGSQVISQRLQSFRQDIDRMYPTAGRELDHQLSELITSPKNGQEAR